MAKDATRSRFVRRFRDGGSFTDANTGQDLRIEGSGSGAISLDLALDAGRQWQWYLSHQAPRCTCPVRDLGAGGSSLPPTVTYLHFGGTSSSTARRTGPINVGGLGATLFRPA
jgi:hypothetical protein